MNKSVIILILKNKLRLFYGTLRYTWPTALGLLVFFSVLLYQILFVMIKIEKGTPASTQYIFYVLVFAALVNFFRIFLVKTPIFRMNAATLHHLYNTKYFSKILHIKYSVAAVKALIISFCISFCMGGFDFSGDFYVLFALLALYLFTCTVMSWIYYHGNKTEHFIVLLTYALATMMLFLRTIPAAVVLSVILSLLIVHSLYYMKLNIPGYYSRLSFIDAATAAQSQNNFALMQRLSNENRPQIIQGPSLKSLPLTKRTALTCKSLIELLRIQKQILIMLCLLLLLGWVIKRTVLLDFLPFFEIPSIKGTLGALCTATALGSLYQLLSKQIENIVDKQKLGLFLPFSKKQILLGYMPVPIILNFLISLILGILYSNFSLLIFILWFIMNTTYCIQGYIKIYNVRMGRIIIIFMNFVLWIVIYRYLMI